MVWSTVTEVTIGSRSIDTVRSVALTEKASETIVEHESSGRSPTFVDVVAVRAEFAIEREVSDATSAAIRVGERGTLRFVARRERADGRRAVVSAEVVVIGVRYRIDGSGFIETITALAYTASSSSPVVLVTREGGTP
ncbi:MAG: hypothetical protein AAGI30_08770 [Planctomycetota bacterium]